VGRIALLGYLSDRVAGWHVARAVGVESEMELDSSGDWAAFQSGRVSRSPARCGCGPVGCPLAASEQAKLALAQRFMMALAWVRCVGLEPAG
jgi:hypothetical protein